MCRFDLAHRHDSIDNWLQPAIDKHRQHSLDKPSHQVNPLLKGANPHCGTDNRQSLAKHQRQVEPWRASASHRAKHHQSALRCKKGEVLFEGRGTKGVNDDLHGITHTRWPVAVAGQHAVHHAERSAALQLVGTPRCADDRQIQLPPELRRCRADATANRVHQHPIAVNGAAAKHQRVPSSKKRLRDRSSIGIAHLCRHGDRFTFIYDDALGVGAPAHQSHHPITDLPAFHPCTKRSHFTGVLESGNVCRPSRWCRILAGTLVQIGTIEPGGPHSDKDLARVRHRIRTNRELHQIGRRMCDCEHGDKGVRSNANSLPGVLHGDGSPVHVSLGVRSMKRRIAQFVFCSIVMPAAALAQARKPVAAPVRLILAPTGNLVRFIVREKLIANTIENDAIGTTTAIAGMVVLDARGKVDTTQSKITVQLDSLKSDQSRRDGYIKGRTLETRQFPAAMLVIKDLQGLPATLPTSGTMNLNLVGDLTVHGVTKSVTWVTTVTADATGFSGRATTHLKFEDFNMTQPSVPVLAHVDNDIKLEYDFHFVKQYEL